MPTRKSSNRSRQLTGRGSTTRSRQASTSNRGRAATQKNTTSGRSSTQRGQTNRSHAQASTRSQSRSRQESGRSGTSRWEQNDENMRGQTGRGTQRRTQNVTENRRGSNVNTRGRNFGYENPGRQRPKKDTERGARTQYPSTRSQGGTTRGNRNTQGRSGRNDFEAEDFDEGNSGHREQDRFQPTGRQNTQGRRNPEFGQYDIEFEEDFQEERNPRQRGETRSQNQRSGRQGQETVWGELNEEFEEEGEYTPSNRRTASSRRR